MAYFEPESQMKRVVVTGMGVVSPLGCSVEKLLSGILTGQSGVARVSLFDPASLPTKIAAEVKWESDFPPLMRDRKIGFALFAAQNHLFRTIRTESESVIRLRSSFPLILGSSARRREPR